MLIYLSTNGHITWNVQVRTTNANVDNSVDLLARVTLPLAASHLLRELLHVLQLGVDALHNTLAVDLHRLVGDIAKGDVVDSAVLGEVDVLTLKHGIAQLLKVGLLGQLDQERESFFGEEVLGEVKQDLGVVDCVVERATELLEALRVLLEVFLEDNVTAQGVVVVLEALPGGELGGLRETRHDDGSILIWQCVRAISPEQKSD